MATLQELYNQPIKGYWENPKTRHIYLVYEGHVRDRGPLEERTFYSYSLRMEQTVPPLPAERILWNAGAVNLRTGQSRKLRLKDFLKFKQLDSKITAVLDSEININYFVESNWKFIDKQGISGRLSF